MNNLSCLHSQIRLPSKNEASHCPNTEFQAHVTPIKECPDYNGDKQHILRYIRRQKFLGVIVIFDTESYLQDNKACTCFLFSIANRILESITHSDNHLEVSCSCREMSMWMT